MVVAIDGRRNMDLLVLAAACHSRNQELADCSITNNNPPANESDNTVMAIIPRNEILCTACPTATVVRARL